MLDLLREDSLRQYAHYTEMLNEGEDGAPADPQRRGLARELARMSLTLNFYTQWYWKIDLYNLMHFLSLRADPHAQYEISAYAEVMLDVLRRWLPLCHEAFLQHRLHAVTLSAAALAAVKEMLAGKAVTQASSGLSKREWRELCAALGLPDQS